jgi:hypothetical protein
MAGSVKWQSRRWWVCLWAMALCTTVIIWAMVFNESPGWLGIAIGLFQVIIGGYIAADTIGKIKHDPL